MMSTVVSGAGTCGTTFPIWKYSMHKCEHLFTPPRLRTRRSTDFDSMYTYGLLLLALPCVWACYDGATPVVSPDGHLFVPSADRALWAFDHQGTMLWRAATSGGKNDGWVGPQG